MKNHVILVLILVCVAVIGCVAANNQSNSVVSDDTRAHVLSQDMYDSKFLSDTEITVLHYEKYRVTCFVMRGSSESAAMNCFKDSEIVGV